MQLWFCNFMPMTAAGAKDERPIYNGKKRPRKLAKLEGSEKPENYLLTMVRNRIRNRKNVE